MQVNLNISRTYRPTALSSDHVQIYLTQSCTPGYVAVLACTLGRNIKEGNFIILLAHPVAFNSINNILLHDHA